MPCVSCPWVSKGLKGQACLAAHCFSLTSSLSVTVTQLSKHSPFIDPKDKGEPTHGHKTKSLLCSTEASISCFTIFGQDASGERKYVEPRSKHRLFYYERNLGYTTIFCPISEDFPLGVWLGDESNPEMRVRVPITPR